MSIDQFGKALVASGLLTAEEVKTYWNAIPAAERPKDGDGFAQLLVTSGKLTKFQAQELLAGRGGGLIMGDYTILAEIGAGGMGKVYKAQHRRMKRVVALKVMSSAAMQDEAAVKRFQREVEAAARLEHPNIVTAYDSGESGKVKYLVMQFVDGGDLSDHVKKHGTLPIETAVGYVIQAARGLAFAHAAGVVHRDIKPANLLLDKKGVVKILDMGLARIEDGDGLTATEQVMGTVDYMSPEQAAETKNADARSDIYSLGCTLWYLLTAKKLFDGDTMISRLMKHRDAELPSLVKTRDDAGWPLEQVFHKMIAKRPQDRHQSMEEVIAALEPFGPSGSPSSGGMGSRIGGGKGQSAELASFMQSMKSGVVKPTVQAAAVQPATSPQVDATSAFSSAEVGTDPKSELLRQAAPTSSASSSLLRVPVKKAKSGKKPPIKLIAAGILGVAILVVAGIIIKVRDQDGNVVAELNVPTGATVEITPTPTPTPTPPTPVATPKTSVASVPPQAKSLSVTNLLDSPDYVWSKPENLGPSINGTGNEDRVSLTNDQLRIRFNKYGDNEPREAVRTSTTVLFGTPSKSVIAKWPWLSGDGLTLACAVKASDGTTDDLALMRRATTESKWGERTVPGPEVNQAGSESRPTLSPDGLTLVFSRDGDLWMSRRASPDESFGPATKIGPHVNNSEKNEYLGQLLADNQTFVFNRENEWYFTFTSPTGVKSALSFHDAPFVGTDVWFAGDGTSVYFAADLAGGFGQRDIWVTRRVPKTSPVVSPQPSVPSPSLTIPAEALTFAGHRYLLVRTNDVMTWDEAKAKAEAMGGHLATITTQAEYDWVRDNIYNTRLQVIRGRNAARVYMGALKTVADSEPKWITGEASGFRPWSEAPHKRPEDLAVVWNLAGLTPYALRNMPDAGSFLVEWDTLDGSVSSSNINAPPLAKAPFDAAQAKAHQQVWAKHLGTGVETTNSVGQKMVLVPPGEFLMGSSDADIALAMKIAEETNLDTNDVNRIQEERPQHRVRITQPFRLAAHEVTIGQFAKFVEQAKYKTQAEEFGGNSATTKPEEVTPENLKLTWRTPGYAVTDDSPVTQVSWNDAVAFCNWLSGQEQLTPCYQRDGDSWTLLSKANGYRLPTESEWEYACRAGTTTQYSFGDDWQEHDKFGWSKNNAGGRPHSVGSLLANPFGLYDMHGNVWECCHDWYDGKWYEKSPSDDPLGPSSAWARVFRGIGWYDMPAYSRSSFRTSNYPSSRHSDRGFRPALSSVGAPSTTASITSQPAVPAGSSSQLFMHDPAFPQWMVQVQAMPAEQQLEAVSKKLMELNPGFDGKVSGVEGIGKPKIENGIVSELGVFTRNITDISPVRVFAGLKYFDCSGGGSSFKGKLPDLSALSGMRLVKLWCGNTFVPDLEPLRGMPLTHLSCNYTQVSSLAPLAGMPLEALVCGYCQKLSDLSPLRGMPLRYVRCAGCNLITDLSPLENCEKLQTLETTGTKVTLVSVAALQKALPNCKIEWDDPAKATTQPAASGTK